MKTNFQNMSRRPDFLSDYPDKRGIHKERLVAFSCKRRGFCPGCGARRMAESAALLVDEVLPHEPMRQWVLSFPYQLRFLFASGPELMGKVLGIVYQAIASHLIRKAGLTRKTAHSGAVTLIQRFGSALNLNVHFICCFWMAFTHKTNRERQDSNAPWDHLKSGAESNSRHDKYGGR